MQTRRFGRSGHDSAVAIFGAAAFYEIEQKEADRAMEVAVAAGVNHIDAAPSYGQAEERLGPWIARERERFFLGCKTTERTEAGAWAELRLSLARLQTETLDLYQLHAVNTFEDLERVTAPGGALEALARARREGLIRHIGLTGHGLAVPAICLEALRRFDFDSLLFPLNFVQAGDPKYYAEAQELLRQCRARNVGVMVIKALARGPWGEKEKTYATWYEPFDEMERIQQAVNFVLSHDVAGLCTPGDVRLLPQVLAACEHYTPLTAEERNGLIDSGRAYRPLFA